MEKTYIALLLIFLAFLFSYEHQSIKSYKCHDCNIIFIELDAVRADHLGCYGYTRNTTHNIDEVARKGILFTQAIAPMPITGPSTASMFTGKYPRTHGVLENGFMLDEYETTLAEILKERGYRTGAVVSVNFLAGYGVDQGFEKEDIIYVEDTGETAKRITNKAVEWLDENKDEKFFLWVHYIDPHSPYKPPDEYKTRFSVENENHDSLRREYWRVVQGKSKRDMNEIISKIIALYDGEINFVDEEVGKLLKKVNNLRLDRKTIVVVVADHGEGLYEHGDIEHGLYLYDATIRVPLIISSPSLPKNMKIENQVRSIDITPTLLDILELEMLNRTEGVSLIPMIISNSTEDLVAFSERRFYQGGDAVLKLNKKVSNAKESKNKKYSIRTGEWKLIWSINEDGERLELYNPKIDPTESNNIYEKNQEIVIELKKNITEFLNMPSHNKTRVQEFDESTREMLRSLGYLT